MLAIRAWFAPDDWSCLIIRDATISCDVLAVRLHVALLHVSCETAQVLVVRQQSLSLGAVEVVVPDAYEREDDG